MSGTAWRPMSTADLDQLPPTTVMIAAITASCPHGRAHAAIESTRTTHWDPQDILAALAAQLVTTPRLWNVRSGLQKSERTLYEHACQCDFIIAYYLDAIGAKTAGVRP